MVKFGSEPLNALLASGMANPFQETWVQLAGVGAVIATLILMMLAVRGIHTEPSSVMISSPYRPTPT